MKKLPTVLICFFLAFFAACDGNSNGERHSSNSKEPATVEISTVNSDQLRERVQGIGTFRALETVEIRPEIDGIVQSILFREAQAVQRGQLLFKLDDDILQHRLQARRAELDAARARLDLARKTHDRYQDTVKKGYVSVQEYDEKLSELHQTLAEVERLEAEIELIEEQIDDTTIAASFNGEISESLVDSGDYVEAGEHMATLYRIAALEIEFRLPERYVGKVRFGQPVEIMVAGYPDKNFRGNVDFVSPAVMENTRDFAVKAVVDNSEGFLKPGMFGRASVTVEVREDRPVIPEEALVAVRDGYIVFVVEAGTAHRRAVRIGLREPGRVEVRYGLAVGEKVVRRGHMRLTDGDPVTVIGQNGQDEST